MEENKTFLQKHSSYVSTVWSISLFIGYATAIIKLIELLFSSAQESDILGFLVILVFNGIITAVLGVIYAALVFAVIVVVTSIPYLIVRGLSK